MTLAAPHSTPKFPGYGGITYLITSTVCEGERGGGRFRLARLPATHVSSESNERQAALTTLPAIPPAMSAKPKNRNNLALQATPPPQLPESPQLAPSSPSSLMSCCLSMRLTMIIPKVEQRPGVQSLKVTCTGMGSYGPGSGRGVACEEEMVASRKNHQPTANCSSEAKRARQGEAGELSAVRWAAM